MGLWLIFILSAVFFAPGFLPIPVICILWGVSLSVYTHRSM